MSITAVLRASTSRTGGSAFCQRGGSGTAPATITSSSLLKTCCARLWRTPSSETAHQRRRLQTETLMRRSLERMVRHLNMKLKSMIFYATIEPSAFKMIVVGHHRKTKKPFHAYLRTEVVDADALHALDMAKPKRGEIVLNAIEL